MRIPNRILPLLLVAALVPVVPAGAEGGPAVTTSVREVGAAKATSGSAALLGYVLEHDVHEAVPERTALPAVRVDRDDHPEAFDGLWLQAGQLGAWFGRPSEDANVQFRPDGTLLENLYAENEVRAGSRPLQAGDRAELALAATAMNTPTPWDRPRAEANGILEWDHAVASRRVSTTYDGVTSTMDVIMFRADIVARGGDVDARLRAIDLPPLVIDLPQTYPANVKWAAFTSRSGHFTNYVESATPVPLVDAGKLILTGSARGYIPEARRYTLPNGAVMNEWHIPIMGVLTITDPDGGLPVQAMSTLPEGGAITAVSALGTRELAVGPGESVVTVDGLPRLVGDGGAPQAGDVDDAPVSARASAMNERDLVAAAAIHHAMDERVDLAVEGGHAVSVDPDYLGEGLLALEHPSNANGSLVDLYTAPAVLKDGAMVPLTRDRLVGLRAVPATGQGATAFPVGWSDGEPQRVQMSQQRTMVRTGLSVEAVYDLGDGVHAFITASAFTFGHSDVPGGRLNINAYVRALDQRPIDARPVQLLLVPESEAVEQGTAEHTTEFAGAAHSYVTAGAHRARSQYFAGSGNNGTVLALRAPAPVMGRAPDPDAPLAGAPLALVYLPPVGAPAVAESRTSMWAGLGSRPAEPQADPPPLGQACGDPQVTDLPVPTSAPATDLRSAWFDSDPANLYATIQVRDLPEAAPPGTTLQYLMHWRDEHDGRAAVAMLDASGSWRFIAGLWNGSLFGDDVEGEVRPGPDGLIRLAIPRYWIEDGYHDGMIIRDVAAHSYANTRVDHAPKGSSTTWGLGGEYVVGTCG